MSMRCSTRSHPAPRPTPTPARTIAPASTSGSVRRGRRSAAATTARSEAAPAARAASAAPAAAARRTPPPKPRGPERVGGLGRREGGDGGQDDGQGEPPEVAGDDGDDEPHDAEAHPRSVDVVDDAEARALEPGEPERLGVGAGAPGRRRGGPALGHQPTETGGRTRTSAVSGPAS